MHAPWFEWLARPTAINVAHWVVGKSFVAKDGPLAPLLRFTERISHMRGNAKCLTRDVVFSRSILVIGDHGLCLVNACCSRADRSNRAAFCFLRLSRALSPAR